MKKALFTILGFTLLIIGFLSLILMGLGLQLSYLKFIDNLGALLGFLIRIVMIVAGLIIIYVTRTSTAVSK
ncbi:hypothetical protein [Portibacter marinus]|uniref:hypothetical protein n=1 Tax=Portibacter marinus TaxID=2898660 RepID=UPI001F3C7954|nr:hypothetical protein [Portibacter marinus]